jgi:hypothetical protein
VRPPFLDIADYLLANRSEITQNDFIMNEKELLPVCVIAKDRLAPVAAIQDVI